MNELSPWQTLLDPVTRHPILVHLPIACALAAAVVTTWSAWCSSSRPWLRAALALQLLFAIAAIATVRSGEAAERGLPLQLTAAARELLHEHEELAEKLPPAGIGLLLLLALRLWLGEKLGRIVAWAVAAGMLGALAWIGWTAHHGGLLVYQHAVGPRGPTAAAIDPDPRVVFFKTEIEPLLAARCAECHNSNRVRRGQAGRLDLTSIAGVLAGGKHAPAVKAGNAAGSLLIERVSQSDPDERMPPEGDPLSAEQIGHLRRWIDEGLAWR